MIYTGSSEEVKKLLEGHVGEIATATLKAKEGVDALRKFCYEPSLLKRVGNKSQDPDMIDNVHAKHYLFEMLSAYRDGGQNLESRMQRFADHMQRPYLEVKDILNYLGLDV